jgi:hypothetical protein
MRKHFTQMSQDEIKFLLAQVRSRSLTFHQHAFDRMKQKNIREPQILASLSYGSIVEAHNDAAGEIRVLVRGKVLGDFVCSVVSLTKNQVITTYWNKAGDHHKTLDKSAYQWDTDLTQIDRRLI